MRAEPAPPPAVAAVVVVVPAVAAAAAAAALAPITAVEAAAAVASQNAVSSRRPTRLHHQAATTRGGEDEQRKEGLVEPALSAAGPSGRYSFSRKNAVLGKAGCRGRTPAERGRGTKPGRLAAVGCLFRFGLTLDMKILISSHSSVISGMEINSKIERYSIKIGGKKKQPCV